MKDKGDELRPSGLIRKWDERHVMYLGVAKTLSKLDKLPESTFILY